MEHRLTSYACDYNLSSAYELSYCFTMVFYFSLVMMRCCTDHVFFTNYQHIFLYDSSTYIPRIGIQCWAMACCSLLSQFQYAYVR